MKDFEENYESVLFLLFWRVSHPRSVSSLLTLHSLVALVIIRAASIWITSSCLLVSVGQLSHTESQYSSRGSTYALYIFSSDFLLTLNLRARRRFNLVQAFTEMFLM